MEAGEPVDRAASVASFFVSRVDTKVDAELERLGREDLRGKAAVANARIAYEAFGEIFSGPEWEPLAQAGAHVQRPLWASTSTKNPDYPDTLYVDDLIGPDTVNTMPDATIEAARDHATPERTVDRDVEGAHALMAELREIGVDVRRHRHAPAGRRGRRVVLEVLPVAAGDARAQGERAGGRGALGAVAGIAGSGSGCSGGSGISGAPGGFGLGWSGSGGAGHLETLMGGLYPGRRDPLTRCAAARRCA